MLKIISTIFALLLTIFVAAVYYLNNRKIKLPLDEIKSEKTSIRFPSTPDTAGYVYKWLNNHIIYFLTNTNKKCKSSFLESCIDKSLSYNLIKKLYTEENNPISCVAPKRYFICSNPEKSIAITYECQKNKKLSLEPRVASKFLIHSINPDGEFDSGKLSHFYSKTDDAIYTANAQCTELDRYEDIKHYNYNYIQDTPGWEFLFDPESEKKKEYELLMGAIRIGMIKFPSKNISKSQVFHNERDNSFLWTNEKIVYEIKINGEFRIKEFSKIHPDITPHNVQPWQDGYVIDGYYKNTAGIFVFDKRDNKLRVLAQGMHAKPSISPDGCNIVFSAYPSRKEEVIVDLYSAKLCN